MLNWRLGFLPIHTTNVAKKHYIDKYINISGAQLWQCCNANVNFVRISLELAKFFVISCNYKF
jgi:hypothetical protein